ncbi:unnamed protein product [Larinioides sclopetarius]|uniref:Uncharacterized protein n=1 Tax=Larinioides sclopetarius TaxID=280406 RepID=A0AAV1ZVP0_9ARAC
MTITEELHHHIPGGTAQNWVKTEILATPTNTQALCPIASGSCDDHHHLTWLRLAFEHESNNTQQQYCTLSICDRQLSHLALHHLSQESYFSSSQLMAPL